MTKYLTIYDKTKTYLFPNMKVATPEIVSAEYNSVDLFTCVIETDASETIMYTVPEPIASVRSRHDIDSSLSDKDALVAIEEILNAPVEASSEPTAEERIAAALEYQNLLSTIATTTTD